MRTRKSILNLATGLAGQALALISSLILRIFFARSMSASYLGLSGLFTNILSMLSLVELGVGPAITFSLYKPLAERDTETVKRLMRLFQRAYRAIGCTILLLGFLFTPVYPHLIQDPGGIPELDLIYWLYVINTGISYFYSYKVSLIIADQNQYMKNIGHYVAYVLMNLAQTVILVTTRNYVLFLLCQIAFTLLENLILSRVADGMYPFLKEKDVGRLSKEQTAPIVRNIRAMLFHNVGNMVVNSTDNILISKFMGLAVSGVYSNYALILTAVRNILARAFDAVQASVGNLYASGEEEKLREVFDRLCFMAFALYGGCAVCLGCLIQPCVRLAFGESYQLDGLTVAMLVVSFYVTGMRSPLYVMRAAAGLYYKDWAKPIVESAVNLIASIAFLKRFGTAGIFMGTIVSALLAGTWIEVWVVYRNMLHTGIAGYVKRYLLYMGSAAGIGAAVYAVIRRMAGAGILHDLLMALTCVGLMSGLFVLLYGRNRHFRYFRDLTITLLQNGVRRLKAGAR